MATRSFSVEDQLWFARLSGDCNPLHVHARFAARTYPGALVVHGLHIVLWALNELLKISFDRELPGLKATFLRPVLVGDAVDLDIQGDTLRIKLRGETMATIRVGAPPQAGETFTEASARAPSNPPVDRRGQSNFADVAGALALPTEQDAFRERFPNAAARLGDSAMAGLAGVSTIVGMECPGLHSVLSELSVAFDGDGHSSLSFRVRDYHPVFSRVDVAFSGHGLRGRVAAFAGRAEPAGEGLGAGQVEPGEFAGRSPLIVGASSGLGRATAALFAAGGGTPVLSYTRSAESLKETEQEVARQSGTSTALRLDVSKLDELAGQIASVGAPVTELYYFATPRIFRRRVEPFQQQDFDEFNAFYVTSFYELVRAVMASSGGQAVKAFYPSTSAIEQNLAELFEYSLAKSAGERLCRMLEKKFNNLGILIERIPRTATRQTNATLEVPAERPEDILLPIIRRMASPTQ